MRTFLVIPIILAAAPLAAASPTNACAGYVGQTISPVSIAGVFDTLQTVAPRDAYESTSAYQQRLDEAARAAPTGTLVIDRPWGDNPPDYKPDKGELPVYPHSLGLNGLNIGGVLRLPMPDPFGGIGFQVSREVTGRSSYEANNGFGAKVTVQHQDEQIYAVFERPLKIGESAFLEKKESGPVITLSVEPARARDIVEHGGSALVVLPKPPFRQEGVTAVAPTFNSPYSTTKNVRVLWADVRCELIYDGSRRVVAALTVK